jgi:hypothetical protein
VIPGKSLIHKIHLIPIFGVSVFLSFVFGMAVVVEIVGGVVPVDLTRRNV